MSDLNALARSGWNKRSDELYAIDSDSYKAIASDPIRAYPREVREMLADALPDFPNLRGKSILVPSSGDNVAVFGFHMLGAHVTSTDISDRQLENAARVANSYGWHGIKYLRSDSMTLDGVPDTTFDLVYMSNGAHVWIGDLPMMYSSFYSKLKPGGSVVFFETHPFHRPFTKSNIAFSKEIKITKPYTNIGPFPEEKYGGAPTYAWRTEDFLRALIDAGFVLRDYRDMQSHRDDIGAYSWFGTPEENAKDDYAVYDWKKNPWAALPSWIGINAQKQGDGKI